MENLNIKQSNLSRLHTDSALNIMEKFRITSQHFKDLKSINRATSFSFQSANMEEIIVEISKLDTSKANRKSDISTIT